MEHTDDMAIMSSRLEMAMKDKGLNGARLADKVGVTRSAMSLFLSGKRQPGRMVLAKMAGELSVTVDYLLGHGEDSTMKEGQENPRIVKLVRDFITLSDQDQQRVLDTIDSIKQAGAVEINKPQQANDALH